MSTAHDDLAAFQQFALQKVNAGEADTLEELFDLWLIEHPTPFEQPSVHEALREAIEDLKAGRHRPAEEVSRDMERKFNFRSQ
jgi:hypothetical protein